MTKKHFVELAKSVKATIKNGKLNDEQREILIAQMAIFCVQFNARFDASAFRNACL